MNSDEKALLKYFRELGGTDRHSILSYAHFLFNQNKMTKKVPETPVNIERPSDETVVAAIKRLKKTYPMLDSSTVLNPASGILTQHLMHGMDRIKAIDELELIFQEKYREYQSESSK